MITTTRTRRRRFVAQGGAMAVAAAVAPGVLTQSTGAQDATPADSATPAQEDSVDITRNTTPQEPDRQNGSLAQYSSTP